MTAARRASAARCAGVWTAATIAAGGLALWLLPLVRDARTTLGGSEPEFDRVLVWTCAALALLAVAWLWTITTAVVVEAARGRPDGVPGVPATLRRLVLAACGVAVVAGLAAPADATPGEVHQDRGRPSASIAGLPLPDRAVAAPGRASSGTGQERHRPASAVVVRPGDTLWDLARDDLGPGADDAAIAARWRTIYALNRAVIGADPDLIQPAQRLRLPTR